MFVLARELGMSIASVGRMSAHEMNEWSAFLSLSRSENQPPPAPEQDVETQLKNVFGGPRG